MRKHDWPLLLKTHAMSGQTVQAFCASRGLTKSKFYVERAKHGAPKGLLAICVQPSALRITIELRTPLVIAGSAADLAQLLRCL